MAINDSDQLLINDGSKTETITISQIRDGSMLNDTDLFLVNDGSKTETITWEQLSDELGPKGIINTPVVLKPNDGAGSGDVKYLKSDAIQSIQEKSFDAIYTGSFNASYPAGNGFNRKEDKVPFPDGGAKLVDPDNEATSTSRVTSNSMGTITFSADLKVSATDSVYILYQSENYYSDDNLSLIPRLIIYGRNDQHAVYNEYTDIDDQWGNFYQWAEIPNTVGDIYKIEIISTAGIAGMGQFKVNGANVVEGVYETNLTVAGPTDLTDAFVGESWMTDGTGAPGPYTQTPYSLRTSKITNIKQSTGTITLTFADPCPDLQYLQVGDVVQKSAQSGDVVEGRLGSNLMNWEDAQFKEIIVLYTQQSGDAGYSSFFYKFEQPSYGLEFIRYTGEITDNPSNYWTIYGSADGTNWRELSSSNSINTTGSTRDPILTTGVTPYQYFKASHKRVSDNSDANMNWPEYGWRQYIPDTSASVVSTDIANRKMIVDGGRWSDGSPPPSPVPPRTWSTGAVTTGNSGNWLNLANFFDGDLSTTAHANGDGSVACVVTVTFNPPVQVLNNITWYGSISAGSCTVQINDDGPVVPGATGAPTSGVTKVGFTGMASKLIITKTVSTGAGVLCAGISIDDVMLIDGQGIDRDDAEPGEEFVTYITKGGMGNVISVDADNYKIKIQSTGDRDNRWIADNAAGTEFAVAGPVFVDAPLLTTDVELQSSEFSTTPPGSDGLQSIVWNLNGIDQPGTTLNPYKPSGLSPDTNYSVKVKHIGFSLGESEWSTTTTFLTGASRSLKEHYAKQIKELGQQLAVAQGTKTRSVDTDERKRARNADGTYRGDDPETPDTNEAWEGGEPPAKGKGKGKKR